MPGPAKHAFTDDEFDDPLFDPSGEYADLHDHSSTREERTLAMLTHLSPLVGLGIVAPLVVYLLKRDESPFVADQAKEALNFHITVMIALICSVILMVVMIGAVTMIVVGISATILSIVSAIRANDGQVYRYPYTLRLI